MATIVDTLFGVSPERIQQERDAAANTQAMAFTRLSPIEQASYGVSRGAYGLAGALGGMLGGTDPELQRATQRQQIASQLDINDPESVKRSFEALRNSNDAQGVGQLMEFVRQNQESAALVGQRRAAEKSSLATATKIDLGVAQENKLRDELALLPPTATEVDIRAVLVKYGDPDKVLAALTSAATRTDDRASRENLAKDANAARIEAAKLQADARLDAAKEAGANRLQIAQMQAQNRQDLATLAASLKGPKVLGGGLQKSEDTDLGLVDTLTAQSQALNPAIASLKINSETGKPLLELGPVKNSINLAKNASGNSSVESRAYADLQRSIQAATNLKTDAAKGVQTDKDVLRFANELVAAFGKNDTKTTLEALTNFQSATNKARENTEKRIDSRRKSQGIESYYGPKTGTSQNPIKLD